MNQRTLVRPVLLLLAAAILMAGIGYLYRTGPQAAEAVWDTRPLRRPTTPMAVVSHEDFTQAAYYSRMLWNNVVLRDPMEERKPLFYAGAEGPRVKIFGANGEPCVQEGPARGPGHAAHAYQCPDGTWEIHIWAPGDIHTQFCIVAHELGHVLGLADDHSGTGVMNQKHCPKLVRVSDKDAAAVRARYR